MSEHATEIDVAGATAALEERLQPSRETIDVARDQASGQFTSKPDESATPAAGDEAAAEEVATTEDTPTAPPAEEEEVSFTHIPDEALTPELLAVKRAMQADYTKKRQADAEFRKLLDEYELESPQALRDRLEIQKQLSDPANWPQLHQELSQYLRHEGLDPRAADAAAAVALGQAAGDDLFEDDTDDYGDGDQSALAQQLAEVQRKQDELVQFLYQRDQQAAEQERIASLARDLTTQENKIRAQYAEQWGDKADEYIESVYDLAGDSGDLSVGLSRLETLLGYDASRYLLGKEEARRAPGVLPGEGVIAEPEQEPPHTLEEGHERAMEYIRAQAAAEAGL